MNVPNCTDSKIFVRGKWIPFSKEVINEYYVFPTMGENEEFLKLFSEVDMAMVSATICKLAIIWKMIRDVYRNFPRKGLIDKVRPWFAFVCANLLSTAHLSDVSR